MDRPRPPPPPSVKTGRSSGSIPPVSSAINGANDRDMQETRLVIGVDFGTTFTGVAYATPPGTSVIKCNLNEITVMKDWGENMLNTGKVPSVISYSRPSKANEEQWGSSFSPNAVTMVHTKLELGLQNIEGELDMCIQVLDGMKNLDFLEIMQTTDGNDRPPYSHKSPEEIVADYLTKVFVRLEEAVDNFNEVFRRHTATDLVVTVPTHWSYMANNSTYRALTKAGFNRVNFPRLQEIMFITESEAAAHYVARFYRDERGQEILKENTYFILCDAGGGTVDVVSYLVKKLHPVLQMEQVGEPTGNKCGSIFINRAFLKWLRETLGIENYRQLDPNLDIDKDAFHASESPAMRYLMNKFDERKQNFDRDSDDFYLDLPNPLQNLTIEGVVDQGAMRISKALMEWFFDVCIGEIVEMIKLHMARIEDRGATPKTLFLVGGFGASDYLQQQLEFTLKLWDMKFHTPRESWTAIVRGAVVCGIEKGSIPNLKRTTSCRHSYAICLDELYAEHTHTRNDLIVSRNNRLAQSQLLWVLNEGDIVLTDSPRAVEKEFDVEFPRTNSGTINLPIYRHTKSDDGKRPNRFRAAREDLGIACQLKIDLGRIVQHSEKNRGWGLSTTMCKATLKLVLILDKDTLVAVLECKGLQLSHANVAY